MIEEPYVGAWAWAAGFIEGEGTFSKNGAVMASQNSLWPLEKLRSIFGVGSLRGPYKTSAGNNTWRWRSGGNDGRRICEILFPLLSPRRQDQIRKQLPNIDRLSREATLRDDEHRRGGGK